MQMRVEKNTKHLPIYSIGHSHNSAGRANFLLKSKILLLFSLFFHFGKSEILLKSNMLKWKNYCTCKGFESQCVSPDFQTFQFALPGCGVGEAIGPQVPTALNSIDCLWLQLQKIWKIWCLLQSEMIAKAVQCAEKTLIVLNEVERSNTLDTVYL